MSKLVSMFALCAFLCLGVSAAFAADEAKEVTLKGTMTCAKCDLKETAKCQNVLQVKEDGKTVNYYMMDNKMSKDHHKEVCTAPKEGVSVTGVVSEKDGKKMITASKVE